MRTITADQQAALSARSRGYKFRVRIKSEAGAWQDVTDINGFNFLRSLSWGENVDNAHLTANVVLSLLRYHINLSPLMDASPANKAWNALTAPTAYLDAGRELDIAVQFGAADVEDPGPWMTCFHGRIDRWVSNDTSITLECRDLSGRCQDAYIERERAYGYIGAAKGAFIWDAQTEYAVNDRVLPAGSLTGYIYRCTVAGTSNTSEPTWPTVIGGPVADGTVTWECEVATAEGEDVETVIQQILTDNVTTPPTLYVPSSPGWALTAFKQGREGALEAARKLALQQGSDVRQVYRDATSQFELTYCTPERTKVVADHTFTPADYRSITRLGVDIAGVRNVVRVIVSLAGVLATDGKTRKRQVIEVEDAASIYRYERRFFEISEDATSHIDTLVEGEALANYALSDLSTPVAEQEVDAFFFPWVQLGDLYEFAANNVQYDSAQTLAVTSYNHTANVSNDGTVTATTVMHCRGKPSGGYMRWHAIEARPGVGQAHQLHTFGGQTLTVVAKAPGGVSLAVEDDRDLDPYWDGCEIHLSTTPGFTPDSTTLATVTRSTNVELGGLEPGRAHYARSIRRGKNSGRSIVGQPGPEVSFTPARIKDIFFDPDLGHVSAPPNGGFESMFNGTSAIPDHWEMVTGDYSAAGGAYRTATSHGGAWAMALNANAVAGKVRSAYFPVQGSKVYELQCWLQRINDSLLTWSIAVEWYTSAKALLWTTTLLTQSNNALGAGWQSKRLTDTAPASAAYARLTFGKNSADAAYGLIVDDVTFAPQVDHTALGNVGANTHEQIDAFIASMAVEAWNEVGAVGKPAFSGAWVNYNAATHATAGYYKDPFGVVHLKGLVKSGAVGSTIFTLPVEYRPSLWVHFGTVGNSAAAGLAISSAGVVQHLYGSNVWFSLDGITFRV